MNVDAAAFTQFCENEIGIAAPAMALLGQIGGVTTSTSLMDVKPTNFGEVWETLARQAGRMTVQDENNRPVFSFPARRMLFAFRLSLEYRSCSGLGLDRGTNQFIRLQDDWLDHADLMWELYKGKETEEQTKVPKLTSLKNWESWHELLKTRLTQERSLQSGCPLIYLLRDCESSTTDIIRAEYDTIDERLIACVDMRGSPDWFKKDNKRLCDLLKTCTVEGPCYTYVTPFDDAKDGRKAYKALLLQAEGPAAQTARVKGAFDDMRALHFNGKSRFTFEEYVRKHQACHNALDREDSGEVISESKKIHDFMEGITDPRLEPAKHAVLALHNQGVQYQTFAECQQYISQEWEKLAKKKGTPLYRIAGVDQHQGGKQPPGKPNPNPKKVKKKKTGKGYVSNAVRNKMIKEGTWEAYCKKRKKEAEEKKRISALNTTIPEGPGADPSRTVRDLNNLKQPPQTANLTTTQAVQKAVSFGAEEGEMVIGGRRITFKVSGMNTGEDSKEEAKTPPKGTPEELQEAASKSAGSQFGRAHRKRISAQFLGPSKRPKQDEKEEETKPPSLDDKIEKKSKSAKRELPSEPAPLGISALSFIDLADCRPGDFDTQEDSTDPTITPYKAPEKGSECEEEFVNIQ